MDCKTCDHYDACSYSCRGCREGSNFEPVREEVLLHHRGVCLIERQHDAELAVTVDGARVIDYKSGYSVNRIVSAFEGALLQRTELG